MGARPAAEKEDVTPSLCVEFLTSEESASPMSRVQLGKEWEDVKVDDDMDGAVPKEVGGIWRRGVKGS